MQIEILIATHLAIKGTKKRLQKHTLCFLSEIPNETDKVFIFNLTTSSHYNPSLNYLTRFEDEPPVEFSIVMNSGKTKQVFLVRDCAVVDKKDLSFDKKSKDINKIKILGKYNCKDLEKLKYEILKVISENPFDIPTYNGITGEILDDFININLLEEIDNYVAYFES